MKQFFTLPHLQVRLFATLMLGLLLAGNASLQAQTINATQTDMIIVDPNSNGKADPGDQIQYKVTIQNTGSPAGTGVQLNAVPDPRTSLAGNFRSSPLAVPDVYAVVGNVGIDVPAGSGIKANDFDDNLAGATITGGTMTTNGGTIMVNLDGSFMYIPPAGFTGTDTYTYTLNDITPVAGAPLTDMTTVTFNVGNLIWFIDNSSVAATSDGRLTSPFKTLPDFNSGSTAAADVIYIEHTGTNYTGGIVLQNNERLFGEGHTGGANLVNVLPFSMTAHSKTLPNLMGTRPVIENAGGDGVTLAISNTLRGFNVGNCSSFGMENTTMESVGHLVVNEVSINNTTGGGFRAANGSGASMNAVFDAISTTGGTHGIHLADCFGAFTVNGGTITNPTTAGVQISNGSVVFSSATAINTNAGLVADISGHNANATFSGAITSTGQGINIQNCTGGTKTFSGAPHNLNTGANTAVNLVSNFGATINFTGGDLDITTTTGSGFVATGGGTVTVSGAGNTITKSGNGNAINISSTPATITFTTINVTGGTGTAISMTSSSGVKNLGTVTVTRGGGGTGIFASNGGTINVIDGTINSGNQAAVDIDNSTLGIVFTSISVNGASKGIELTTVTGSFTVNGTGTTNASGGTIQNIVNRGIDIFGAANITLRNIALNNANTADAGAVGTCDFGNTLSCNGALYLRTINTLVLNNIDVNGTEEQGLNGANITAMTMTDCSFTNCGDDQFEGCMKIRDLQGTCSITNSTFTFPEDQAVEIVNSASAAALNLTVTGCTFSDNFDNPIANDGLFVSTASNVANTVFVDNSSFLRLKGRGVQLRASAGTLNADVTDCTISKDTKRFMSGVQIISEGTAVVNTNVNRNTIVTAGGIGVAIQSAATSTLNSRVNNNIITGPHACADCADESTSETPSCSCTGQGITIFAVDNSTGVAEAVGNTITGIDNAGNGIAVNSQGDGTLNVLISNNNITFYGDAFFGIDVLASGPSMGGTPSVCARVINNALTRFEVSSGSGSSVHFRARASGVGTSVNLQGPGGPVGTNWDGNGNTPTVAGGAIVTSSGTGTITFGGACTVPGHATAMIDPADPGRYYRLLKTGKTSIAGIETGEAMRFSRLNK